MKGNKDEELDFLESLNKEFSMEDEIQKPYMDSIKTLEDINQ